jgi:predicted RNA-binding Zn-ribbon protein involved in translation (DUF1610 family)
MKKKGDRCAKCKTFTPYSMWALAHVGVRVTFTCPKCGEKKETTIR